MSRQLPLAENLRRMGIRKLVDVGVMGVLDLILPERDSRPANGARQTSAKPGVLPIETQHPVMRHEPRSIAFGASANTCASTS